MQARKYKRECAVCDADTHDAQNDARQNRLLFRAFALSILKRAVLNELNKVLNER